MFLAFWLCAWSCLFLTGSFKCGDVIMSKLGCEALEEAMEDELIAARQEGGNRQLLRKGTNTLVDPTEPLGIDYTLPTEFCVPQQYGQHWFEASLCC